MDLKMAKPFPRLAIFAGIIGILALAQVVFYRPSEPYFNSDETRHVMMGVFFRDMWHDLPITRLREYTIEYYLQYPALSLLIWPPFFHVLEGAVMLAFGTCTLVPTILVGVFAVIACGYLYRLVNLTHDPITAAVAVLIFGFTPYVVFYSRRVMLEVPCLALCLIAIFHFLRYLEQARRRDLFLAAIASALAALTRYDAVYLLVYFAITLALRRPSGWWRRREVWLAALLALLLVLPYYWLAAREIGWGHARTITEGNVTSSGMPALANLWFFPAHVPRQIGWAALIVAGVGLIGALRRDRAQAAMPYVVMLAATYLTFTPLGDLQARHSIYWLPAFAVLAAQGIRILTASLSWTGYRTALAGLVIAATATQAFVEPMYYVRGYEAAARYVVAQTQTSPFCLIDTCLEGNLIYQIRRRDPNRRLWVLRGDKLFYGVLSDPAMGYEEYVKKDQGILAEIFRYDPELIVVECPRGGPTMPMAEQLRAVLEQHPEQFRLEITYPIETNEPVLQELSLKVYRNLARNPKPDRNLQVEMIWLRRSLGASVPD
jgi:hypothetical protein